MKNINKLFLFIIFLFCQTLFSYGQNVTIKTNKTVKDAIEQIKKTTGYSFVYSTSDLNTKLNVNLNLENVTLSKAIEAILSNQKGLEYEIKDKIIVIKKKNDNVNTNGKSVPIKGKIVDTNGEPIIGASIKLSGTKIGTVTDIDGIFNLNGSKNSYLEISYIGYKSIKIKNSGSYLNIIMNEDSQTMNEIVVVGYGTRKKINMTGSIATIGSKEIEDIPSSNLSNVLNGRLSGVRISTLGGKPGVSSSINIRSESTWNNTDPLYVIDGVVRDKYTFDGLDGSEIENLSVLKDGASAAIYGSRAANGVILVTTKRGYEGKPIISYSGSIGQSDATKLPDIQNAYEHAMMLNSAFKNQNLPETSIKYYTPDELDYFYKQGDYSLIDEAWKKPIMTRHNVNINGGNNIVNYFFGGTYYYEDGSFNNLNYN